MGLPKWGAKFPSVFLAPVQFLGGTNRVIFIGGIRITMQGLGLAPYHEAVWKNQDIPHMGSQAILLMDIFCCMASTICLPASLFVLSFPKNQHILSWWYSLCV